MSTPPGTTDSVQGWLFPPDGRQPDGLHHGVHRSGRDPDGQVHPDRRSGTGPPERPVVPHSVSQRAVQIDPDPPGRQLLAPTEPPDRRRDRRRPQLHVTASCGQVDTVRSISTIDAAIRADSSAVCRIRMTCGALSRVDSPRSDAGSMSPSSPWNSGPVGFEIEPLDVEQTPVAGVHQYRNSPRPGLLANAHLHVQRITFLDHQVQAIEEFVHVVLGQPVGEDLGPAGKGRVRRFAGPPPPPCSPR